MDLLEDPSSATLVWMQLTGPSSSAFLAGTSICLPASAPPDS